MINLPNWMSLIDDVTPIRLISMPGTHDSCAIEGCLSWYNKAWSTYVYTQNMSLDEQLAMGIRYLDIRIRRFNNTFTIHHGKCYLHTNFEKVLESVSEFLIKHPSETVLMRIREEQPPNRNNKKSVCEILTEYRNRYSEFFWYSNANIDPSIGECRRKIVILQNFDSHCFGRPEEYAENIFGLDYRTFNNQDNYEPKTINEKNESIKNKYEEAACDRMHSIINHLSGREGRFGTPVALAIKTNYYLYNLLKNEHLDKKKHYIGIIPTDFVKLNYKKLTKDEDLIVKIIECNFL